MKEKYVIIVAAGLGRRMNSPLPKQFLEMDGKPILMHTIEAFSSVSNIILVLNADYVDYWRELCCKFAFQIPVTVAVGGAERFNSVKNALAFVPDGVLVGVHDGVRPFVSQTVIDGAYADAEKFGSAIPVVDCVDSVRLIGDDGVSNAPFDRSRVKLVQTPQVFDSTLLKQAYSVEYDSSFTDDASVFERSGHKIHLCPGDVKNIKITVANDLSSVDS